MKDNPNNQPDLHMNIETLAREQHNFDNSEANKPSDYENHESSTAQSDNYLKELQQSLAGIDDILNMKRLTEDELDELVEKLQRAEAEKSLAETTFAKLLKRVEEFKELVEIEVSDYPRLEKEEVITSEEALFLVKLQRYINQLQSIPPQERLVLQDEKLEELLQVQARAHAKILLDIERARLETAERKQSLSERLKAHYQSKIAEQQAIIEEISKNPEVLKRRRELEQAQAQERLKQAEKERAEHILLITKLVDSVFSRVHGSVRRLGELIGDNAFDENLLKTVKAGQSLESTRQDLLAILATPESSVSKLYQVVPWLMRGKIEYGEALDYLQYQVFNQQSELNILAKENHKEALALLARAKITLDLNQAYNYLFGGRNFAQLKGAFIAHVQAREEAERRKKQLQEERQAALRREAELNELQSIYNLVKRGGFMVGDSGAILWEEYETKNGRNKGRKHYVVIEVVGQTGGITPGNTFYTDFSNAPTYLKEAYEDREYNKARLIERIASLAGS